MQQLDAVFSALGDPTRRAILARLCGGETTLSELADPFDISLTGVSKHVRILSEAGLVAVEKRGRTRHCRLQAAPMKEAVEWLSNYRDFWEHQFDALSRHLAENGDAP